ncbi:MAG: helix-turn-helix domain-containing protein [Pirellulaceae bacterium]
MESIERLDILRDASGFTVKQLAIATGLNYRHLAEVLNGNRPLTLRMFQRISEVLGASPDAYETVVAPAWFRFHKIHAKRLAQFHEQFANAKSVLTLTLSMDSYLQTDEMLQWSNEKWLEIENWNEHRKLFLPYAQAQRAARSRSNSVHRLVCPLALFTAAREEEIAWLSQIRGGLGEYEAVTCVTIIRSWGYFRQLINRYLPADANTWQKICIVDNVTILIHLDDNYYLMTVDGGLVRSVREWCEKVILLTRQDFPHPKDPRDSKPSAGDILQMAHRTEDEIENLLWTESDRDAAHRNHLFFAKMLTGTTYVPPNYSVARPSRIRRTFADRKADREKDRIFESP